MGGLEAWRTEKKIQQLILLFLVYIILLFLITSIILLYYYYYYTTIILLYYYYYYTTIFVFIFILSHNYFALPELLGVWYLVCLVCMFTLEFIGLPVLFCPIFLWFLDSMPNQLILRLICLVFLFLSCVNNDNNNNNNTIIRIIILLTAIIRVSLIQRFTGPQLNSLNLVHAINSLLKVVYRGYSATSGTCWSAFGINV